MFDKATYCVWRCQSPCPHWCGAWRGWRGGRAGWRRSTSPGCSPAASGTWPIQLSINIPIYRVPGEGTVDCETSRRLVDRSIPQWPIVVVVHVLHAVCVLGEGVHTAGVGLPIGSGLHLGAQPLHHWQHPPRASLSITNRCSAVISISITTLGRAGTERWPQERSAWGETNFIDFLEHFHHFCVFLLGSIHFDVKPQWWRIVSRCRWTIKTHEEFIFLYFHFCKSKERTKCPNFHK